MRIREIILAPGGLESLRARWLREEPFWPMGPDELAARELPDSEVAVEGATVSTVDEATGIYLVRATVPVPESWASGGSDDHLRGLALVAPGPVLLACEVIRPAVAPASIRGVALQWAIGGD